MKVKTTLLLSIQLLYFLLFFSCFTALLPVINTGGENRDARLVPRLRGKAFNVSALSLRLAVHFLRCLLSDEEVALYFYFAEKLYHKWMFNFVKRILCITEI